MTVSGNMDQANIASRWNLCQVEWQSPVEAFSSGSNILESIKNVVSSIFANLANIAKSLTNPFISLANTVYEVLFPVEDTDFAEVPFEQPEPIQQEPTADYTVANSNSRDNVEPNVDIINAPVFNNVTFTNLPISFNTITEQPLDDIKVLEKLPFIAQDKREFYQKAAIGGTAAAVATCAALYLGWDYLPYTS